MTQSRTMPRGAAHLHRQKHIRDRRRTQTISEVGSTISKSEYRDIERVLDMLTICSLPPRRNRASQTEGLEEYFSMVRDVLRPNVADVRKRRTQIWPAQRQQVVALPTRMSRPQIDPRTGRIMPVIPLRVAPLRPYHSLSKQYTEPIRISETSSPAEIWQRSTEILRPPVRYRVNLQRRR